MYPWNKTDRAQFRRVLLKWQAGAWMFFQYLEIVLNFANSSEIVETVLNAEVIHSGYETTENLISGDGTAEAPK